MDDLIGLKVIDGLNEINTCAIKIDDKDETNLDGRGELKSDELKTGELKSGELKTGELKTGELKSGELKTDKIIKSNKKWSYEEEEEQLINLVKKHEILVKKSGNEFKLIGVKNKLWAAFANQLNKPVSDVKSKWSTLRAGYRNALKRASGSDKGKEWIHMKMILIVVFYSDFNSDH